MTQTTNVTIMFTSHTNQAMTKDMISLTGFTEREVQAESLSSNRMRDYPFAAVTLNPCAIIGRHGSRRYRLIPVTGYQLRTLSRLSLHAADLWLWTGQIRVEPRAERTRPFVEMCVFLRSINPKEAKSWSSKLHCRMDKFER